MHILNRVVAAGALVVPMVLGAAGVAMADVSSDSSMLPRQIKASTDGNSDSCRHEDEGARGGNKGGLLDGLLGGGNGRVSASRDSECRQDDNGGQGNNGPFG